MIPLPLRSGPLQGWVDAIPYVKTKYAYLVHNDAYALDDFFVCELIRALAAHKETIPSYVIAAPMLYESKADGSLASHATQSNLRLVLDNSSRGATVRHDHSLRRALNRGNDVVEGAQLDFLEDHGFLIETAYIERVIDPHAAFTLEYVDMILSVRSNGLRVLFVPTARLEFRITEFSWRDIPYFVYKRSESTTHATRDYIADKWSVNVPNTGFWTYIKYTVMEGHVFGAELAGLKSKDHAALILSFFQMAGFNQYSTCCGWRRLFGDCRGVDFIDMYMKLETGWTSSCPMTGIRSVDRPQPGAIRSVNKSVYDILHVDSLPHLNLDLPNEYLPFVVARLSFASCAKIPLPTHAVCGLIIEASSGACSCWINMPTFKSGNVFFRGVSALAGLIKIPSRVRTFAEMWMFSQRSASALVGEFRDAEAGSNGSFELNVCEADERDCNVSFVIERGSQVRLFRGAPASVDGVRKGLVAAGIL